MKPGREVTGAEAKALYERATELDRIVATEGGSREAAMIDGKFAVIASSALATEVGMPERSLVVRLFDAPSDRAEYLNKGGSKDLIQKRGWAVGPPGFHDASRANAGADLIAAAREWLRQVESEGVALESVQEKHLEDGLLEQLLVHRTARNQVYLKQSAGSPAILAGWPGVGWLDLEIETEAGPAWAELKWAKSADYLYNCLWDAAKLATAVRAGVASAGYLVAGAPVSAWEEEIDYAKVFEFSGFEESSITNFNARYAKCWDFWRRENPNTYPVEVASPVCTWPVGEVRSANSAGAEPWAIRVAKVTSPGEQTALTPHDVPVVSRDLTA